MGPPTAPLPGLWSVTQPLVSQHPLPLDSFCWTSSPLAAIPLSSTHNSSSCFLPPASGPRATLTESLLCSGLWIPVKRALGLCLHGSLPLLASWIFWVEVAHQCPNSNVHRLWSVSGPAWGFLTWDFGERMQHPFLPAHHLRGVEQTETPSYKRHLFTLPLSSSLSWSI